MSRAGSKGDIRLIVQRFLNSYSATENDESDSCLHAWHVSLSRTGISVDRLVAIVQHAHSEQTVLFILVDSKDAAIGDKPVSLQVLLLNNVFQCDAVDSDHPVTLKISGREPRSNLTSTSSNQAGDRRGKLILSSTAPSTVDSDEPSEPVGLVYLRANGPVPRRRHLQSLLLTFDSVAEAGDFRDQVLGYSQVVTPSSCCHGAMDVEMGEDAVNLLAENDSRLWLSKYLREPDEAGQPVVPRRRAHPLGAHVSRPCSRRHARTSSLDALVPRQAIELAASSGHSPSSSPPSCSPTFSVAEVSRSTSVGLANGGHRDYKQTPPPSTGSETAGSRAAPRSLKVDTSAPASRFDDHNHSEKPKQKTGRAVPKMMSSQSFQHLPSSSKPLTRADSADPQPRHRRSYMPDHEYRLRLSQTDVAVRQKLLERVDRYSQLSSLTIFIGSWNVNGRQDSGLSLDDWLAAPEGQPPADVYIFGFQELDLSMGSVALNKTTPTALEDRWINQLQSALGGLLQPITGRPSRQLSAWSKLPEDAGNYRTHWAEHTGGGYIRLRRVRLSGLLLVIYLSAKVCRQNLETSEVASQLVATGIWNMLGNKGAVGIRLTLCNTSFCFINCHLAAGEANQERRNQDFNEVKRKMVFERRRDPTNPLDVEFVSIDGHDNCFVFGDLNLRIGGLDSQTVRKLIDAKEYQRLLDYDELNRPTAIRRAFANLTEAEITFPPTYKFDTNTNNYDTSEKQRIPSYCDRIFWKSKHCEAITYRAHNSFTMSDHKPVSGYFKVGIRRVNKSRFQHELEAVVRSQDLVFNLRLPQAQLDRQDVDFGPVHFYEVCRRSITLTNIGLDSLEFQFIREAVELPSWLTVTPEARLVDKDESVTIDLEIFVKPDLVVDLNSGVTELSAIIILRLVGGKDFFISITGHYVPSSFGLPLALLLTLEPDEPVGSLPVGELRQRIRSARCGDWQEGEASVVPNSGKRPFYIPKEIVRLTEFISRYWEEPDLLRGTGQYEDFSVIRELLDNTPSSVEFPDSVSVHSAGYCLLMFLNTMTDAVIPQKFQEHCLDASSSFASITQVLATLPIDHQNLFFYVIAFLRRCLEYQEKNDVDVKFLANSFGEIIFRPNPASANATERSNASPNASARRPTIMLAPAGLSRQERVFNFMRHFLDNDLSASLSGMA